MRQWRFNEPPFNNDDEGSELIEHTPPDPEDYLVRLRNVVTGQLVGTITRMTTSGDFLFTGLAPATYMVEVVDDDGNLIARSDSTLRLVGGAMLITDAWVPLPGGCGGAFLLTPLGLTLLAGIAAVGGIGVIQAGPQSADPTVSVASVTQ